jgi:hypothetical protein
MLILQDGGVEVNAAKADIDSITQQLEAKRQAAATAGSSGVEPGVLDDEHHQLLQQLKAAKARSVFKGSAHVSRGFWAHGGGGGAREPRLSPQRVMVSTVDALGETGG